MKLFLVLSVFLINITIDTLESFQSILPSSTMAEIQIKEKPCCEDVADKVSEKVK